MGTFTPWVKKEVSIGKLLRVSNRKTAKTMIKLYVDNKWNNEDSKVETSSKLECIVVNEGFVYKHEDCEGGRICVRLPLKYFNLNHYIDIEDLLEVGFITKEHRDFSLQISRKIFSSWDDLLKD